MDMLGIAALVAVLTVAFWLNEGDRADRVFDSLFPAHSTTIQKTDRLPVACGEDRQ